VRDQRGFCSFEAGLLKMKCHIIDALPQPGGQLAELYPKKPIFDIPGYPSVNAGELLDNLMEQIKQFQPGFTLGETAVSYTKVDDEWLKITETKELFTDAKLLLLQEVWELLHLESLLLKM
jgi:thioredoxin reductase (NADPH)